MRPRGVPFFAVAALALAMCGCAKIRSWMPFKSKDAKTVAAEATKPKSAGRLLLAGGGRIPGAVIAEAAKLTSGTAAKVLIIPLASAARDPGRTTADVWTKAGFADVEVLDADDVAHANAQIEVATFLWMTGGDQTRLVGRLLEADLALRLRARFDAGALVGGTNAGATAVAELVLAGASDDDEMQQGRVETAGGLGLWPGVIVDQAFVAKKRFNRLMAAVIDHPHFVGIGIDEGTGVVVEGTTLRVVGEGNVVVIDARRAKVTPSRPGDASAATGVEMQVLAEGMSFDLARR